MNTEITEYDSGWLFYDADCAVCQSWVNRLREILLRRGVHCVPLQAGWAARQLGLPSGKPLLEMKLVMPSDRIYGGADAVMELARLIWWTWPLWALAHLPGGKPMLRRGYCRLAANRHCSGGKCALHPPAKKYSGRSTITFLELP